MGRYISCLYQYWSFLSLLYHIDNSLLVHGTFEMARPRPTRILQALSRLESLAFASETGSWMHYRCFAGRACVHDAFFEGRQFEDLSEVEETGPVRWTW
jgi:hypothetical protein